MQHGKNIYFTFFFFFSALNFTGGWFRLKVAYDSSVIRSPGSLIAATRPLGRLTSRANLGRNKKIPSPVDADSQVRPGCRTAGASPDAISTDHRCCRALHELPSVLCNEREREPLHTLLVVMRVTVLNSNALYPIVVREEGSMSCSL